MGVWNLGLYSSDFALDLRSTISAVLRLPFSDERLVDFVCESEPQAAQNTTDEDHTTFWLVLADQLAKRGIVTTRARELALAIIDTDADLASMERRGAQAADLKKRRAVTQKLRVHLETAQPATKPRVVLKKPQPYLMEIGDMIRYPTSGGKPINPYASPAQLAEPGGPLSFSQDGYGAFVVIDSGRAFDFLAWYRPVRIAMVVQDVHATDMLVNGELLWVLGLGGTCSAAHFKRMQLEKIGTVAVDPSKLLSVFPAMRPSHAQAISDISIANSLYTGPSLKHYALAPPDTAERERRGRNLTMRGIGQILTD
jgi:hypothetical protein